MTPVVPYNWSGQARPFAPTAVKPLSRYPVNYNQPKISNKLSNFRRLLAMQSLNERVKNASPILNPFFMGKLPMEVILTIFEFAARSNQTSARALSLVCRHARTIAAPEVFRTIAFSWGANLPSFLRFALSRSHLCPSIHNLWLGNHYAPASLLARCSNLDRIAMEPQSFIDYCTIREDPAEVRSAHYCGPRPPLRAREVVLLSYPCDWSELDPSDDFTIKSLQSITHLWLTRPSQLFTRPRYRRVIPCLSRVTHLGINLDIAPGGRIDIASIRREMDDLVQNLPSLTMLVLVIEHSSKRGKEPSRLHNLARLLCAMSERVYVVPMPIGSSEFVAAEDEILPLFKASAAGRGSLWDMARQFRNELGTERHQSRPPRFI